MAQLSAPLQLGQITLPHRLILAPMCGITLLPFRKICKDYKAGLVFDQMVSAKALTMRDAKSIKMMEFEESERPFGLQLFGPDPDILAQAASIMEEFHPDIIDLNLGCPAKKIVNDGGGSALLQDEVKLAEIFKKMRQSIKGLFTVKMRAGWDDSNKNAITVAKLAESEGVDAIAIHARTRSQGYSGHADWSYIKFLKENLSIPVIGNGDVKTASDAQRMMDETGCDAVMTGRGAFTTPWIFENAVTGEERVPDGKERLELVLKQYQYAMNYHGDTGGIRMMRKHLMSYTKGLRGGSEFRNSIVRMTEFAEIESRARQFFTNTEFADEENHDSGEDESCES